MEIFEPVISLLVGGPVQAVLTVAGLLALVGQLFGIWRKLWRFIRKRPAAQDPPATPLIAVSEGETESRKLVRRLAPILDDLGNHVAGLGHVMSMPLGMKGLDNRFVAMEHLFGEYDRVLPDVHALTDQKLAHAVRKQVLSVRTDYLPRAKQEVERNLRALENRPGVDWLARQHSTAGEILETQGKHLKSLAGNLRKLHPEPESMPVPDAPSENAARIRVATRLLNNATSLMDDVQAVLAGATDGKRSHIDGRDDRIQRWLKEFAEDIRPHLHELGDIPGEERIRRIYGDLGESLPKALKFNPVFVWGVDDPPRDWVELYKPLVKMLEVEFPSIAELIARAKERGDIAGPDEWTPGEIKQMVDQYFARTGVNCPKDGAQVLVSPDMSGTFRILKLFCPNCRRKAENL